MMLKQLHGPLQANSNSTMCFQFVECTRRMERSGLWLALEQMIICMDSLKFIITKTKVLQWVRRCLLVPCM